MRVGGAEVQITGNREVATFGANERRCAVGLACQGLLVRGLWIAKLRGRAARRVCFDEASLFTFMEEVLHS